MTEKIFLFQKKLEEESKKLKIEISPDSLLKLARYFEFLKEEGKITNLIGNLGDVEIADYLFLDSMLGLKAFPLPDGLNVIDVGCGAGFPGLVLKIIKPRINLTLLDSSKKKINFVKNLSQELGVEGIDFINDRAEISGKDKNYREKFDLLVSKAFAPLPLLLEMASPFVKIGGKITCWKGLKFKEEVKEIGGGYKTLGLGEPEFKMFGDTVILMYPKISKIPERFPRSFQAIKRKPVAG